MSSNTMKNLQPNISSRRFEVIKVVAEDGDESWSARQLMPELGYDRWENFDNVIKKAVKACENSGLDPMSHFREVTKEVTAGSGALLEVRDYRLTRYACYLIAQNGDPSKKQIALAQTYFAIQTRQQEVIQRNSKELERLMAREKLSETEKKFSGVMVGQGIEGRQIGVIRAKGDKALFGGNTTDDMKRKLSVPTSRPIADFLPTITIKAKDLAAEMTTFKTKEKGLKDAEIIGNTHKGHNQSVREALVGQGIFPENLPKEEDIRILERRMERELKKIGAVRPKELTPPVKNDTDEPDRLVIRIPRGADVPVLQSLNALLRQNRGPVPVVLELPNGESVRRLELPYTVRVTTELKDDIEEILNSV